ncbi:hypothetical protein CUJ88_25820 [Paraburkholderia hospita]|uniref:Uncharacterized protein n=1 Tax=Paraburkholderia hospita TaxID=169430 RepID=A0AAN1JCE0_9BURK|nr:hypothetical protein C2L64_20415 [Paraburkholderia hospita]AXF01811.1 hypothetical protein CUJ88_25820 [Paraburkholderia hospita]EIM95866.1 hypothetical protein WQE_36942 [Paraburkholderia hospita]OUL69402.1 hypothetical protein CA601_49320 [Paraburkholderia hospita]OUL77592.1 hypothetical protein CA602_32830 [Paraburkholderia hospita]
MSIMEPRSFARSTCAREDLRPSIRDNCLLITAITLAMIGDRTGVDPSQPFVAAHDRWLLAEWNGHSAPALADKSSAFADIGEVWVLCQQRGRLLTLAAPSSRTAASRIREFTLSTLTRHPGSVRRNDSFRGATDTLLSELVGKLSAKPAVGTSIGQRLL